MKLHSALYPFILAVFLLHCHCQDEKKVHVVYMGDVPKEVESISSMHHGMLTEVLGSSSSAQESLVHSYGKVFNGFVARLSDKEVERIRGMEGVVSVFPNNRLQLHTTRSWDFMGFPEAHPVSPTESDIIIGMLDTGIWPENPSFRDEGFGAPPRNWKGKCDGAHNFTCNNKVIGARFYDIENISSSNPSDIISPRDTQGHGSHTASTAAGRLVDKASYFGIAEGRARGGVQNARIAVYKVCWGNGFCTSADILAAFEDAIADGVDLISVSLGSSRPSQYYEDPIAIGSFHAMKHSILTSASAGNAGPFRKSVANYAPWLFTVAASTIDRSFVTKVVLGNGQTFLGTSLNGFNLQGASFPLLYSGAAANYTLGVDSETAKLCFPGTLTSLKVRGGIVLCDILYDGSGVLEADAIGVVMPDFEEELAYAFPIPATVISFEDYEQLLDYVRTAKNPTATILSTETTKDVMAPIVASFSSRGPSPVAPEILKPDITAPGSNIIAAWSPLGGASVYFDDKRKVDYYIISGTSMSCPHVTGAAAYVKSFHPTWSPAAIKSALITTAKSVDPRKNEDAELSYGSGHINPLQALKPGLVYDASEADYVNFLCKQGYNTTVLRSITGDSSSCKSNTTGKAFDLNYPSFALPLLDGEKVQASYTRTVTNVGSPNSTYHAKVTLPPYFSAKVEPSALRFSEVGERKSFVLKIVGSPIINEPIISGKLDWTDGIHVVRSPIAIFNDMAFPTEYSDDDITNRRGSLPSRVGSKKYYKNSRALSGSKFQHWE